MHMCGNKNPGVRIQYVHTILVMKFVLHALYTVPHVRVQSEVFFGLQCYIYIQINKTALIRDTHMYYSISIIKDIFCLIL